MDHIDFKYTGKAISRIDGRLKVTGEAKYANDFLATDLVHAVLVNSPISKGTITAVKSRKARTSPGVLKILTHENAPKMFKGEKFKDIPKDGTKFLLLQGNRIFFNRQPIAIVVADTLERARYAARLLEFDFSEEDFKTNLYDHLNEGRIPKEKRFRAAEAKGNADSEWKNAPFSIDEIYRTPIYNHNPMGLLATLAHWENNDLTIYNATQSVYTDRSHLASVFTIPEERVTVHCPYTGGAFGIGLRTWPHVTAAALAAKEVGRPVKLVLSREQMYVSTGYRPMTWHRVALAAEKDGTLTSVIHEAQHNGSKYEEFSEAEVAGTEHFYKTKSIRTDYEIVDLDLHTPHFMRGPGEATDFNALETAMDELADTLNMDPVALRVKNHSEKDAKSGKPWSSKSLLQCYELGKEKYGWDRRKQRPKSISDGDWWVGHGMASAFYPTFAFPNSAELIINEDSTVVFNSGATDIGVGTYTIMNQFVADLFGVPFENVTVNLGTTDNPRAPAQGGSNMTTSLSAAVYHAFLVVKENLIGAARAVDPTLFKGSDIDTVLLKDGSLRSLSNTDTIALDTILVAMAPEERRGYYDWKRGASVEETYEMAAFGAHFAEVRVHKTLGIVRLNRVVSVFGAGRIMNQKTARSQMIGACIKGLGMGFLEQTIHDHSYGRVINADLGEYAIPVQADVPEIDIHFIEEKDEHTNPIGTKGIGEIGLVGVSAALGNAVFNASGARVRNLPITMDKIIETYK